MKYFYLFFILLIFACTSKEVQPEKIRSFEDKHEPFDNTDLKLFGPNPSDRDIDYLMESARKAKADLVGRENDFTDEWTQEGPGNIGGRVNAIAIDPQNDNIIYAGFARGGLWKTIDAGENWESLWDDQLTQSVSAITIDPTDSDIIYAGSGDINISGNVYLGDGLYKSENGGQSWTNIGLESTKVIGKIIINPENTNELLVATMGNIFKKDENRGVYKSTDGGLTWKNVLFVSEDTGVHDIVFHPENPNNIIAAAWTRHRTGKESSVAGEDCSVYSSTDFGETWTKSEMETPTITGRPAISFQNNDPNIAFAMIMNDQHRYISLHKSLDSGETWTMIDSTNESTPTMMGGFGWFFGRIGAYERPEDGEERLYLCGVNLWSFNEETATWEEESPPWWTYEVHADKHAIVRANDGSLVLGTDGGIYRKEFGSTEWIDIENIPNNMFYRVEVSPHLTDQYYGGMQDNGTSSGNSNTLNEWIRLYGGDGFQTRFHPEKSDVQYFETQNGNIIYTDLYSFVNLDLGPMAGDRRNWDMQYILSPHDPNIVYTGTFRPVRFDVIDGYTIFVDSIGPSLTDSLEFISSYHTITSLDESPIVEGLLYYGTADGNIWKRQDGEWKNINNDIEKHYVTSIKASPSEAGTVYVTLSNYKFGDDTPRIYMSTDYGETWESIHNNLPIGAVNDIIIYDDFEDKLLFAATHFGVYGSVDRGQTWERVGSNMPLIPVNDMVFSKANNTLVAGTYGRSVNTYDLTPVFESFNPDFTQNTTIEIAKIFPNPTSDFIRIESEENIEFVEIFSADGNRVYKNRFITEIDLSSFSTGLYVVKFIGKEDNVLGVQRVVKE